VGQGSTQPPGLVFLEYVPSGRTAHKLKTFAVTGKAVTFDTGGISIKPAQDMGGMKYDKCGGTVVLGVLKAAAALKLPHRVIGVIPIAENSVGSRAYRPGDIIRMYNGKTVDVSNTDAEGRLILADAMSYACEKYQPDVLIDLATLTGGVVVALGSVYAGLFSSDDKLAADLIAAGEHTGEWLWRLPLHERYRKLLDAPHADISNSGGREAHPIQGGMFLREFVPAKIKWAHLDIAGVANQKKDFRYWRGENASGFGVRLLIRYLQQYK
ncbi:MAG TPA: leucyl aminopeptidase family protein, partial [Phycisphaerae bacterium]|nr:leucyl aminopeptidase family protein [Phycisphaerae bacterium]